MCTQGPTDGFAAGAAPDTLDEADEVAAEALI